MRERKGGERGRERVSVRNVNLRVRETGRVREREGRPRERVDTKRVVRYDYHRRGLRSKTRNCWWTDDDHTRRQRGSSSWIAYDDTYQSGCNTNNGDWVEVTRKKKLNKVTMGGRPENTSHYRKERKATWRDKADITTFYFSRFPEGMMEKDMWRIFQKWGKVWEVFIPRIKNKLGHRFGFVRFKEVVDVQRLERQLDDSIFLGGVKLFVNRPKFDRRKEVGTREKGLYSYGEGDKGAQKDNKASDKPRSYAEVVKEPVHRQMNSMTMRVDMPGVVKMNHSPVILHSNEVTSEWLSKAWVARLKNRGMFERVEEELKWLVEDDNSPCYWVDDWVIFPYMDEAKAARLIHQEQENGATPISELQKWSPELRPTYRLTWVLIWGLPLSVWEEESMAKVLAEVGEVVEVDAYVEAKQRLDVARVLVRMQMKPPFQATIPATIDGSDYVLHVAEDTTSLDVSKKIHCNPAWFPPSPFSTQPNTPVTGGVLHPWAFSGDEVSDGASDDLISGYPEDWDAFPTSTSRRDQWVRTLARRCSDQSDTLADVDPVQRDNVQISQGREEEVALTLPNDKLPRNGDILNGVEESAVQGITRNEKHSVKGRLIDQAPLTYTMEDIQSRSEKSYVGDKGEVLPHHLKVTDKDNDASSQQLSKLVNDEMGHLPSPISSVTKVYVRRKEVMTSKSKAQQVMDPMVDCSTDPNVLSLPPLQEKTEIIPASTDDPLTPISKDSIQMQYALLKEMGLSCGEDDNKLKGMLLCMENRDVMMAVAEKGAKKPQP